MVDKAIEVEDEETVEVDFGKAGFPPDIAQYLNRIKNNEGYEEFIRLIKSLLLKQTDIMKNKDPEYHMKCKTCGHEGYSFNGEYEIKQYIETHKMSQGNDHEILVFKLVKFP